MRSLESCGEERVVRWSLLVSGVACGVWRPPRRDQCCARDLRLQQRWPVCLVVLLFTLRGCAFGVSLEAVPGACGSLCSVVLGRSTPVFQGIREDLVGGQGHSTYEDWVCG